MSTELVDNYVDSIRTQDVHKRMKIAEELTGLLNDPDSSLSGLERLIDGLVIWASSSNFKVRVDFTINPTQMISLKNI